MSAPTIRNSTAATATNAPTSPSDTAIGDLVVVVHLTRTSGDATIPTHTLQSGFTSIDTATYTEVSAGRLSAAYKVATAAGANAYNAFTSNIGSDFAGLVVITAGTFNATTIADVHAQTSSTSANPPDPPSIVTPEAHCLVLAVGGWLISPSSVVAVTPPSTYAEVWEMAGSLSVELSVASLDVAAAGTENPGAFGDDTSNVPGTLSLTIALRPVGSTGIAAATASATAVGRSAARAPGAAAATAAVTAVGRSTVRGAGAGAVASAALGTASGPGLQTGAGAAASTSAAAAVGRSIFRGIGAASAVASAASVASGPGLQTGAGTATAVAAAAAGGRSIFRGVGAAAATSTATGAGAYAWILAIFETGILRGTLDETGVFRLAIAETGELA